MPQTIIREDIGGDSVQKGYNSEPCNDMTSHGVDTCHVSTRKLLWKLDTRYFLLRHRLRMVPTNTLRRILPLFILLVLCSFLDRTNVGNAKLFHLEADLHMTNAQYNKGLTAFYPLYIVA